MNTQEGSPSLPATTVGTSAPSQGCPCSPNYANYSRPLQGRTLRTQPPNPTREIKPQGIRGQSEPSSSRPPPVFQPSFPRSGHPLRARSPQEPKDGHHAPSYPRGAWESDTYSAPGRDYNAHNAPGRGTTLPMVLAEREATIHTMPRSGGAYTIHNVP